MPKEYNIVGLHMYV